MITRLADLLRLLATAWRIWRQDGATADLEIAAYEQTISDSLEDNIIWIAAAPRRAEPDHNSVHLCDRRRRTH